MKQELVRDWMAREVITIERDTSLAEVHEIVKDKNIRRLPIVDRG